VNKQAIVFWGTMYIALAIPAAMLLGRLLRRALCRSIPSFWVQPGYQLPCPDCGGLVEIRWQEDGIWLCCAACGSLLSAERYQWLRESKFEPAD
jgi:ribosomal protein L37AE/L43A